MAIILIYHNVTTFVVAMGLMIIIKHAKQSCNFRYSELSIEAMQHHVSLALKRFTMAAIVVDKPWRYETCMVQTACIDVQQLIGLYAAINND